MKTLRGAVIAPMVLALVCLSGAGMAQDRGYYASIGGMFVLPREAAWSEPPLTLDIPMKNGFGIVVAGGRALASGLRAELEIGYRAYEFDGTTPFVVQGEFSTISLMANGIYDFDFNGFRPYAGLGVGLAAHRAEMETPALGVGEANVFAYQVLAGVGYRLSDQTEVLLGYRYFGSAEGDFGAGVGITTPNHNFEVGLRYGF